MDRYTRVLNTGTIVPTHGQTEALKRLAEYEDTGLTPEEVQAIVEKFSGGEDDDHR